LLLVNFYFFGILSLTNIVSALTISDYLEVTMWEKSYSTTAENLNPGQIWEIWSNIDIRSQWDDDTEWAEIKGPFCQGAFFYMKIQNGPKLKMEITECIPDKKFTDTYYFPLARLDGIHEVEKTVSGIRLTTTI
jgi:hypothetical protein